MTIALTGLPPLSWTGLDGEGGVTMGPAGEVLTLCAKPGVDWTNDAAGGPQQHAATALAFAAPAEDFVLSARVSVDGPRTTFDAGALAVWSDRDHWAKLCNEFSPQGDAMVVSVVTDRFSDDCNGVLVDGAVFLRVARIGRALAFHASPDGQTWDFVRTFRAPVGTGPVSVGFMAQAPLGDDCVATFDTIVYAERTLADLRDGS